MPIEHLTVISTNLKYRLRYGVRCLAGRGRPVSEFEEWVANLSLSDDVFVALLRRLAGQVARTKPYPPPEGYDSWSDDAVHDLVNEVYARKGKQLGLKILERRPPARRHSNAFCSPRSRTSSSTRPRQPRPASSGSGS